MKKLSWFKKIPWVKLLIGVIVAVTLLFVLDFLSQNPSKPKKSANDKLQSVVVKKAIQNDLVINLKYFGYIEDSTVYIGADRVQGRIKDVCVSVGDEVSQGCTLFTLDVSSELSSTEFQLSELENAKDSLNLEINQLRPQVNKLKDLYNQGLVKAIELDEAKNQLKKMELKRDQLNEQHELLDKTLSGSRNQARVLSPVAGRIEEVTIVPGTYIGQQDVIKIKKKQLPTCLIMVDEADIDRFILNKKVKTIIGNEVYEGRIKSIKGRDEQKLLFPVEIEIDTTDKLLTGKTVKVLLETYKKENGIMIPRLSVIKFDDETYVYVLNKDKTVSKRNVMLGKSKGNMVEIIKGLKSDDKVIVEGQFSVSEGEKVILIDN